MATTTGQVRTDNIAAFRVHTDLHREILELEPNSQALTVFLNNINKGGQRKRVKTPKFRWPEYELDDRWDAINAVGGYADNITSWVVDTADLFYPESLVKVPRTGEVVRVSAVNTGTNTLTVVRSYGAAAAAAVLDNEPLFIVGNAREEGAVSLPARSRDPVEVINYTQIFKTWVDESGTSMSSDQDTSPHSWRFNQRVRMIEHQIDKELALLTGTPGEENGVAGKVRTTGGILHFATANIVDAGGTLTEVEFETWLRGFLHYGDKNMKVVFLSELAASVLNNFAHGKLQTSTGATRYGVAINEWVSAHGTVKFVSHPLLEGATYGGYAIGVDFGGNRVAYRYLHGESAPGGSRDTHIKESVQEADRDGRKDEILTECGLQMSQAKTHGVLTGITG